MKQKNRGFALVVGMLLLLVLTILGLVVMRGTQLELAMATAVTRQEQAFEAGDTARSFLRQVYNNIILDPTKKLSRFKVTAGSGVLPTFVEVPGTANNCASVGLPGAAAGDTGNAGISGPAYIGKGPAINGLNCFDGACLDRRLQMINTSPSLITLDLGRIFCPIPTQKVSYLSSGVQMGFVNAPGRDAQSDELIVTYGIVAAGKTEDGAFSQAASTVGVETVRPSN